MPTNLVWSQVRAGASSDDEAWISIARALAVGGGRVLIDAAGELTMTKTWWIPRMNGIVIEGLGRGVTILKNSGIGHDEPLMAFAGSGANVVSNFILQNVSIVRNNGGTVLRQFAAGEPDFELRDSVLRNLGLRQNDSETLGHAYHATIEFLHTQYLRMEDITLEGGGGVNYPSTGSIPAEAEGFEGRGIHVVGSHLDLRNIHSLAKNNSPTMLLHVQSGSCRIERVRSEGGRSRVADVLLSDCNNAFVQSLQGEGDSTMAGGDYAGSSRSTLCLRRCTGAVVASAGIPRPATEYEGDFAGIWFVQSVGCVVVGGFAKPHKKPNHYAVHFDAKSHFNTLAGFRVLTPGKLEGFPANQIRDDSGGSGVSTNRATVIAPNTAFPGMDGIFDGYRGV